MRASSCFLIGLTCALSASAPRAEDLRPGSLPPGFVSLADVAPDVTQDMRYAGRNNFTGRPVPGYGSPQCWLREDAARALALAEEDAGRRGFHLVVYDCYRPLTAVKAFLDWSQNDDETTKPDCFPRVRKADLFAQGYIAEHSTHSTGLAVDIGVLGWDFGTPFDYFDKRSWTFARISRDARARRRTLVALMRRHGFENYPREWWHFTYKAEKWPPAYDAVIE